jgi:hypothetical protein
VWVVVAPISSTITSWLSSGRPRQFIEIALNNRCAIRFHLEGPWRQGQTVIASPGSPTRRGVLNLRVSWLLGGSMPSRYTAPANQVTDPRVCQC